MQAGCFPHLRIPSLCCQALARCQRSLHDLGLCHCPSVHIHLLLYRCICRRTNRQLILLLVAITLSMVSERFAIAVAEIIIYAVLLPIALFVTIRHGIFRSVGYFYLCTFCCLRILAAGLGIASENDSRTNRTNLVWSEILGSVGLGPLLIASFSLIVRVYV